MAEIKQPMKKPGAFTDPFAKKGGMGGGPEKKRQKAASEYKKSLQEKQTLKRLYGLSEKQFKRYVTESLDMMGRVSNVSDELVKRLEKRLDNVVFRLGFAKTRAMARQMVSHAYFKVNGKPVNIPSYQVQKDDVVSLKETKKKKGVFVELPAGLKKMEAPLWLKMDKEKLEAKTIGEPSLAEVNLPVEISLIFEFYSR
ncbi:MAG TPA: 30S ribosomal protein S4 [Negativicutes bacterium]|nr:30S ribosomal protein S4 [Negativicutes bacterium]